jgi:hypothetical protein
MIEASYPFRLLPLSEAFEYMALTERTRGSLLNTQWPKLFPSAPDAPRVYVCEAFGGADPFELYALFSLLSKKGDSIILVWTDDFFVPPLFEADVLAFQTTATEDLLSGYFWETCTFGPHRIDEWKPFAERRYLASFVGSRGTDPCREVIFQPIFSEEKGYLIKSRSWWDILADADSANQRGALRREYCELMGDSKFVFCPRGNGPSSIRRWEAVYSGAIPVFIGDVTDPFGVCLPSIRVFSTDCPAAELAQRLHDQIAGAGLGGDGWQRQLAHVLKTRLDNPCLSPDHTFVGRIVAMALQRWQGSKGFGKRQERAE